MVSKEYLSTAQTLLRIAENMTHDTAGRLRALAEDYEQRARKADLAESAKAPVPFGARGAGPRAAKSG
jgi:hypothetical protein